ncbi:MAG: head-tail adaptor protein [Comamonadaceae bacterium]|nr:MAG: head-tail adaptor protein [Comamonadaceae bacterium]
MKAGQLDQRVTLEAPTSEPGGWGQPEVTWTPVATVWASVEPISGREYVAMLAAQSEVIARIRIRWRPGITNAMRVLHGDTVYNIKSVIDTRSARLELVLMCRAPV